MKQSLCAHVKSLGRWLECCQCHRVPMSMESLGMALSWGSHTHPTDTHRTSHTPYRHTEPKTFHIPPHTQTEPHTSRTRPTYRDHSLPDPSSSSQVPVEQLLQQHPSSRNIPCPSMCALSPQSQHYATLSFSLFLKQTMAHEGVGAHALCPSSLTGCPVAAHSPTAALAQLG